MSVQHVLVNKLVRSEILTCLQIMAKTHARRSEEYTPQKKRADRVAVRVESGQEFLGINDGQHRPEIEEERADQFSLDCRRWQWLSWSRMLPDGPLCTIRRSRRRIMMALDGPIRSADIEQEFQPLRLTREEGSNVGLHPGDDFTVERRRRPRATTGVRPLARAIGRGCHPDIIWEWQEFRRIFCGWRPQGDSAMCYRR